MRRGRRRDQCALRGGKSLSDMLQHARRTQGGGPLAYEGRHRGTCVSSDHCLEHGEWRVRLETPEANLGHRYTGCTAVEDRCRSPCRKLRRRRALPLAEATLSLRQVVSGTGVPRLKRRSPPLFCESLHRLKPFTGARMHWLCDSVHIALERDWILVSSACGARKLPRLCRWLVMLSAP